MAQQKPPMSGGKLSEVARHVVLPSGIVSTAWPSVRDTCARFGVTFDDWQDGIGRAIFAKRADGLYAAGIGGVVLSIPRQVGKTFLVGAVSFALCLMTPGTTVLWTAHRLRTANETFAKMQAFARRARVRPNVAKIVLGSGDEEIVFRNGSRILFGARERGFGRGFDNVAVEVFDEAQILTENAIDDMVPATNTAENPLLFFIGTPPKPTDPSEVFTTKRAKALSGEADDTVYIEFSADRGCDPLDRKQWAKANPSYPGRTPAAAMLRMKEQLTDESFIREALGVWDEGVGIIPNWDVLQDPGSRIVSHRAIALAVSQDRQWASLAWAGRREDGLLHVEVFDRREGTDWVLPACVALKAKWRLPVRIQSGSPAASLVDPLRELGVEVELLSLADHAQAVGQLLDAASNRRLRWCGGFGLTEAVRLGVLRAAGDVDVWAPRRASGDISPLVAVTLAVGGVPAPRPSSGLFLAVT